MGAKGKPKTGGRKIGSINKRPESLIELHAMCAARGVNVFESLLEYVYTPGDPNTRLAAIKELMKYLHPQLRSVDISGTVDLNPQRSLEDSSNDDVDAILIEKDHGYSQTE